VLSRVTGHDPHDIMCPSNDQELLLSKISFDAATKEILRKCWTQKYENVVAVMEDLSMVIRGFGIAFDEEDNVVGSEISEISEFISKFRVEQLGNRVYSYPPNPRSSNR
jgi:hypothetical protein